ncbi:MAG: nuclear transport factor 2 family protein [Acidimicrobiia bacterium]
MSQPTNVAHQMSLKSAEYTAAHDKDAWLALYADDAVICDPVGVSPLDQTGLGHRGKEAISAFYDLTIAPNTLSWNIRESYPAGDSCANVATLTIDMMGTQVVVDLVAVYRANEDGKLASMHAYWSFDSVVRQLSGE